MVERIPMLVFTGKKEKRSLLQITRIFQSLQKMTRNVQSLPQKLKKFLKKQDQLQRTNPKHICKRFMIYL